MSNPESISSKIIKSGVNNNICKISFLFFSPPENPSFKFLFKNSVFIFKFTNKFEFVDVNCTTNNPNLPYVEGYPTISLFNINNEYLNNYEENRSYEHMDTYLDMLN